MRTGGRLAPSSGRVAVVMMTVVVAGITVVGVAALAFGGLSARPLWNSSRPVGASGTQSPPAVPAARLPSYSEQQHAGAVTVTQAQAIAIAVPNLGWHDSRVVGAELTTVGAATTELGGDRPASFMTGDDVQIWLVKVHYGIPIDTTSPYAPPGAVAHYSDHLYIAIDATTGHHLAEGTGAAGLSW